MIQVKQLSKSYHDGNQAIQVFDQLNFQIAAGQTRALMGQSGSGKSSLLHVLGGFDQPDQGQVLIQDQDLFAMNDHQLSQFRRQQLGMVFQQFNLIPSLTAADNISFVRRLNGLPSHDEFCQQLIETLGLEQRLHHYPNQLSGGEQQRVAIARALASQPPILLADEPTGNLDEDTAHQVMVQLMQAVALNQVTLLLVTHSHTIASYLQHTWQLTHGQLLTKPTADHDYNDDANP